MPDRHALLGPSSAHKWLHCPPSARLEEKFPNESTSYAAEGTNAHTLCEYKLKTLLGDPDLPTIDFEADEEMERCSDDYRDFVEEEFNAAKAKTPDAKLYVELQIDFSQYVPDGFGTSDSVIVSDDTLEIIDFKYGKGVRVDALGNPQLRLYALGSYLSLGCVFDFTKVKMVVFQPRLNHVDSDEITLDELLDWADEHVGPRARLAYEGKGEFCVGDHCRFCRAGSLCRARAEEAFAVIDKSDTLPSLLTDEEIAPLLSKLENAEKWISAIKAYAEATAISGKKWPGFKLVESRTIRKVEDPIKAANILRAQGFSDEDFTTQKLKGIGDLEKLLGKSKFAELLGGLVVKPQGQPTLVSESDKRKEINPLADAFKED